MCAGNDCYWMAYSFSDFHAKYFNTHPNGFASGSVAFPPKYREVTGDDGEKKLEPNPDYNMPIYASLRSQFEQAAEAHGKAKYPDTSNGCDKGCSCSVLDGIDPKDIKVTSFTVTFDTIAEAKLNRWKVEGSFKVTAKKLPGMCVPGEAKKTPSDLSEHSSVSDLTEETAKRIKQIAEEFDC